MCPGVQKDPGSLGFARDDTKSERASVLFSHRPDEVRLDSSACSVSLCCMSTSLAPSDIAGTSQWKSQVAVIAPIIWATMKPGTSEGRMPAKVSLAARAM